MALDPLYDDYLYARISEDDLGTEKGVARQLRDGRNKSAADGGRVMAEFSDNDISALLAASRPEFDKLMAAVTAPNPGRRQRRIVVVHTSRLWRNRTERAHGIDTLGRAKIIIAPIHGPTLDLRTAAGRMVAGMLGEVDTGESETKGERIADAARERAEEGRAHSFVSYGWRRVYEYDHYGKVVSYHDVVNPDQTGIVREIVRRLLAGETLTAITADLNARGVPAPKAGQRRKQRGLGQVDDGSRWGRSTVKKLAVRPANIGLRMFHAGRDDEALLPAAWPAIIDIGDHEAVQQILSDPSRTEHTRTTRPAAREHLLTWGIGECGVCGSFLISRKYGPSNARRVQYQCRASACAARDMRKVDGLVSEVMVRLLSRGDALDLLDDNAGATAQARAEVKRLKGRLRVAADQFAMGAIEEEQLSQITARLRPQLAAAQEALGAVKPSPFRALAAAAVGEQAAENWAEMTVLQRRAVMESFNVRVIIDRASNHRRFDPTDVRIVHRATQSAGQA